MSIRTYLLYVALVLLLLIIIGTLVWPFLHVDDFLRNRLLSQLGSSFEGTIAIRRVTPGFLALNIYSIEIRDTKATYALNVREMRIAFSVRKFLSRHFDVVQSIDEILLLYPEATTWISVEKAPPSESQPSASNLWDVIKAIPEAAWVERFRIESGSFQLLTSRGDTLWAFQELNAELRSTRVGELSGRLSGGVTEGGLPGVEVKMRLDTEAQILESSLSARLHDVRVGRSFGIPDSLELAAGSLQADLRYWAKGDENGLDGEITLHDLVLVSGSRALLSCDTLNLTLGNWTLSIPTVRAHGLASRWTFSGQIPDLRRPSWDLQIQAESGQADSLQAWIPESLGLKPSGNLRLAANVSGVLRSPVIQLDGDLQKLQTGIDLFQNISFSGQLRSRRLTLNRLTARCSTGDVLSSGMIEFGQQPENYRGDIVWRGPIPGLRSTTRGILNANVLGSKGFHQMRGTWAPVDAADDQIELNASASRLHDRVIAQVRIPEGVANIQITASNLSAQPTFHFSFDNPKEILRKLYEWEGWNRLTGFSLKGELDGTFREMDSRFEIFYGRGPTRFQFDGKIRSRATGEAMYVGALSFQRGTSPTLNGSVVLDWRAGVLTLANLDLDNSINARGSVDFKTGEIGLTEMRISSWDVSRGIQLISPDLAKQVNGILDGRMELYGTVADPFASINLYASRGHFRDQTDFWAVFSAEIAEDSLQIKECNIGRGVLSLLRFSGKSALDGSGLDFHLVSDRADVSDFLRILGGNPLKLSGPLKLDASLKGSYDKPDLNLTFGVYFGQLYKIRFERLTGSVQMDSTTGRLLTLRDLQLIQSPGLMLAGYGLLPFFDTAMDLHLTLSGDVLAIPHLIEDDILISQGQGQIEMELTMVDGRIHLKNARLSVRDGLMKFPDVIDEIRSLEAGLHLEGNSIMIDELKGQVDRQLFSISNNFGSTPDAERLPHLYFSDADLDLGAITIETEGRGLNARIPTIMPKGIKGFFRLEGKNEGEHFTIAGPVTNPLIRGSVRVSGTMITYPFPPGKGNPSTFVRGVLSVLQSTQWDLEVLPERDNRYVKEIQSKPGTRFLEEMSELLTTVDVNLTVNPGISSLNVLGAVDDGTFRLMGSLISTRGTIEYLDMKFKVEQFNVEFDEYDPLPWVEGRGQAVYIDSLGQTRNIYLTLYVVDPVTGERTRRGRWGDFVFMIEDDAGSSQEQILAAMGYSPETFSEKVTSISGMIISDAVMRRWIRPIERELETLLNLDFVRLQPTLAQHLFETELLGLDPGPDNTVDWGAYFLRQSQLSIGKYISDDLFLTYTGLWESGINAQNERRFGFLHHWSVEYRIRPISRNLLLNLGYEYDSLEQLRDREITVRYSILF